LEDEYTIIECRLIAGCMSGVGLRSLIGGSVGRRIWGVGFRLIGSGH